MVSLLLAFVGRAVAVGLCHLAYQDWLKVRLIVGCWLRNVVYAIICSQVAVSIAERKKRPVRVLQNRHHFQFSERVS